MQTLCISTRSREGRKDAEDIRHLHPLRLCALRAFALKAMMVAALATLSAGCGKPSIKTHPVRGSVEVKDGDVTMLTGSTIQFVQADDETIRPYANIDASGNYIVKTLYKGEIVQGAPEGKYKARIMLGDESDEGVPSRKGKGIIIHPRFLEFEKSGLSVTVPSSDYKLSLSKK
jgi:hypothetical protein